MSIRLEICVAVTTPLDGSSNIDANITDRINLQCLQAADTPVKGHCRTPPAGFKQVAAGYALWSSTIFVYSTGHGRSRIHYRSKRWGFLLSHENIRSPSRGKIYSLNEGNYCNWSEEMQRY